MPRGAKGSQNDPKVGPLGDKISPWIFPNCVDLGRGLGGKGTGTYFNIVTQATNSKEGFVYQPYKVLRSGVELF